MGVETYVAILASESTEVIGALVEAQARESLASEDNLECYMVGYLTTMLASRNQEFHTLEKKLAE